MNNIEIVISGEPASGKTAMAKAIEIYLNYLGFIVNVNDDNGNGFPDNEETLDESQCEMRMKAILSKDTTVSIKTRQTRKTF